VFIFYLVDFTPLTYLDYHYPWWGHFIGLLLALSSMICVPAYMVYMVSRQEGTLMEKLRATIAQIRPDITVEEIRNQHISNAAGTEAVTAV